VSVRAGQIEDFSAETDHRFPAHSHTVITCHAD
jgi:hypothetical protein